MTDDTWDEAAWAACAAELDRWRSSGRLATFWWRDDDAGAPHPGLTRLLGLAARLRLPLGVAVVPAWLDDEVAAMLREAPAAVAALQHGWAHANHETAPPPGERKLRPAECGAARAAAVVLAELAAGWTRLGAALGPRARPVLVPPWNRIAPGVAVALPAAGYTALSGFGPRHAVPAVPGLARLNCHADPIVWREGKRFAGAAPTLGRLTAHLADRRAGRADPAEPTGVLTHHRDMTEAFWGFLEEWLGRVRAHPGAAFPDLAGLVAGAGRS